MTFQEFQDDAGDRFLFHYTDGARADAIIEERCFVSGPRVARGFGIYATSIAPVSAETIGDVIVHCFRGEATPAEVNHAIVVRRKDGDVVFEATDDPYQWVLPTGPLELVHVEGIYVAALMLVDDRWEIIDDESDKWL